MGKKKNQKNKQAEEGKAQQADAAQEQPSESSQPVEQQLIKSIPAEEKKVEISEHMMQQIDSTGGQFTIEQKIKAIEQQLANVKLGSEEKDKLKTILASGDNAEAQKSVHEFLKELQEKHGGKYRAEKDIKKLAPLYDTHDFWDSQPVPKTSDNITEDDFNKQIDEVKTVADIRAEPLDIPAGYHWANVNIEDEEECKEVYDLLTQNYVEDDDNMFRFDYSVKFLQWALTPPGYNKDWLFGVRGGKKNKLYGFISGIPVHMTVNGQQIKMAEINFLCVHKLLRTKRLAPILIREVTRRVNRCDMWQAIYTAGVVIPTPIAATTYYHRSLNPKKLVEVGFSSKPQNTPMARFVKMNKVADNTSTPGLRPMEKKDVPVVHKLLNTYLQQYKIHIQFTVEEIAHFLLPRENVVESFVVEDEKEKKITDFISFYSLPSSVLKHPEHTTLHVAYSLYNVPGANKLVNLQRDALILAKQKGYDVFNALDVQQNEEFLTELKFGMGDGNLHYYLYNWRIQKLAPHDCGIVLV